MMEIGNKIKELREKKELSQEQLGSLAYVTGATINRIENGHHYPSRVVLKSIADALNVKVEDLKGE